MLLNSEWMMSREESGDNAGVQKLSIDRPHDFRFHVAYNAYSEAWDNVDSEEAKLKLNEMIEALSKNEISYQNFYKMISPYRAGAQPFSRRFRIKTQRKREWRKKAKRSLRNARHRR